MQSFEWVDATSVEHAAALLAAATADAAGRREGGRHRSDGPDEGRASCGRRGSSISKRSPGWTASRSTTRGGADARGAGRRWRGSSQSPEIRSPFPALAEAAGHAATPQVRNAATIGGNLLQRPRCWYFRSEHFHRRAASIDCRRARGREPVPRHLRQRTSRDGARVDAGDGAARLRRARCTLTRPSGETRTVPLKEFLLPPDARRDRDAAIEPGEVLTRVTVPAAAAGTRAAYHKQTERDSYDWPICDVAVVLGPMQRQFARRRSCSAGWRPRRGVRSRASGSWRQARDRGVAREAARAAVAGATPLAKNAYKVPVPRDGRAPDDSGGRGRAGRPGMMSSTDAVLPSVAICAPKARASSTASRCGGRAVTTRTRSSGASRTAEPVGPDDGLVHPHACIADARVLLRSIAYAVISRE